MPISYDQKPIYIDDTSHHIAMSIIEQRRAELELQIRDELLTMLARELGSRSQAVIALAVFIDYMSCKTIVYSK